MINTNLLVMLEPAQWWSSLEQTNSLFKYLIKVYFWVVVSQVFKFLPQRDLFHWFQKWTFHIDYIDLNEIRQRAKDASRSAVLILLNLSDAFQANDIELIQHDKTCFKDQLTVSAPISFQTNWPGWKNNTCNNLANTGLLVNPSSHKT